MPIHAESEGQSCIIRIAGEMTISGARALKDDLMELMTRQKSPELALDLSGVEAIDTTGVQILILLNREARISSNRALRINAMSDTVRTALRLYNIQELSG